MDRHTFVFDVQGKPLGYVVAIPDPDLPKQSQDAAFLVKRKDSTHEVQQSNVRFRPATHPDWLLPDEWLDHHRKWRLLDLYGAVWHWPEVGLRALVANKSLKNTEILYLVRTLSARVRHQVWGPRFLNWMTHPTGKLMTAEERDAFISANQVVDAEDYATRIRMNFDLSATYN